MALTGFLFAEGKSIFTDQMEKAFYQRPALGFESHLHQLSKALVL